jgi:hypothetical protein
MNSEISKNSKIESRTLSKKKKNQIEILEIKSPLSPIKSTIESCSS